MVAKIPSPTEVTKNPALFKVYIQPKGSHLSELFPSEMVWAVGGHEDFKALPILDIATLQNLPADLQSRYSIDFLKPSDLPGPVSTGIYQQMPFLAYRVNISALGRCSCFPEIVVVRTAQTLMYDFMEQTYRIGGHGPLQQNMHNDHMLSRLKTYLQGGTFTGQITTITSGFGAKLANLFRCCFYRPPNQIHLND